MANIFAAYAQPVRSIADYQAEDDNRALRREQLAGAQRNNALADLTAQQTRQTMADQQRSNALIKAAYGQSDVIKALRATGDRAAIDLADKQETQGLGRNKTISENAGRDIDTQNKAVLQWRDWIGSASSPEQAASLLEMMHQDARLRDTPAGQVPVSHSLQKLQSTPFEQWKQEFSLGAKDYVDKNKPTYQQQNLGRTMQTLALPGLGGAPSVVAAAPIAQSADNAASVAATLAGQRSVAETARRGQDIGASTAAAGRAQAESHFNTTRNDGKWTYDSERGGQVNTQTGEFRPAVQGGVPIGPKDKPLPEGAQKQIMGTRNLQDAVANYREKLAGFSKGGMLSPDARAGMGNAYNNMMLQAKEAYNLGVLNGPDYEILQAVVKDPTRIGAAITSKSAMDSQAAELSRIAAGIEKTAMESHGKKYTPRVPGAAAPPAAAAKTGSGATVSKW